MKIPMRAVLDVATMAPIQSAEARASVMALPLDAGGALRARGARTAERKVEVLGRVLRQAMASATAAAVAE